MKEDKRLFVSITRRCGCRERVIRSIDVGELSTALGGPVSRSPPILRITVGRRIQRRYCVQGEDIDIGMTEKKC